MCAGRSSTTAPYLVLLHKAPVAARAHGQENLHVHVSIAHTLYRRRRSIGKSSKEHGHGQTKLNHGEMHADASYNSRSIRFLV